VKTNPGQVTIVRAKFTPPTTAFVGGQLTEQDSCTTATSSNTKTTT
jgi:hypothetical protein